MPLSIVELRKVFKTHLGRGFSRRVKEFDENLSAICASFKNSYLLDFVHGDSNSSICGICAILKEYIQSYPHLNACDFRILVISDSVIIVRYPEIILELELVLNDPPVIVDVSKSLSKPQIVNCREILLIEFVNVLLQRLKVSVADFVLELDDLLESIPVPPTTVFGLILNYPVVYYVTDEDNCLSNEPLVLCQIMITNQNSNETKILRSFTVPKNVFKFSESRLMNSVDLIRRKTKADIKLHMTTVALPVLVL